MAFYVDTGDGGFREFETMQEAREIAEHALQSARDFRSRMGWTPFWGRIGVEIRRGRPDLLVGTWTLTTEQKNQLIVESTKPYTIMRLAS